MNMALREEAVRMMDTLPDEGVQAMIRYMAEYRKKQEEREKRIEEKRKAFEEILSLSKYVPDLDPERELAESREERFGHANFD